ncbi:conserved hypothetical protein [Neospora caninum Liverpool]|uniref:Uncharacterized protein n=1 Tax=Neospora caninum (strain Liverpool) TaxID=572307 RepID=F0VPH5_NEOCL|nr:conserved hypothetical protein [Neospora caninum Liverpool]CBZ55621.1 conserved hypothetical protein [Neospora caninum Liverpool]CEL70363.1 TPA: hypothetical protein BN1204_060460 [Neospora caninum Liverpool]|eukprot:XP_003885649.1 conserved hypothetical protein [Neospora caninum Liverpool]
MDASFYSPLTSLFQGHLQQPSLTLDLPLLHASRPHKLPPSLLVPTHTFLLPDVRPSSKQVMPLSLRSSYVLDCSFVPQHPSLLVCSSAPAGFVVALDLATGQAVQSFLLPPATRSRLDGVRSDNASLYSSTGSSPSLTAAHMHGDPSSPLLFLGTSVGDIFAYDLRFAGSGRCGVYGHPTLHLERAHDGIVSSLRTGGGGTGMSAVHPTSLPGHVLVSGGLQDNWIRVFDLRFPFHYSTGPSTSTDASALTGDWENGGGSCGGTVQRRSRGRVPYPIDAIQLNPGCRSAGEAGGARNVFFSSSFSATRQWLETSADTDPEEALHTDACGLHGGVQTSARRERGSQDEGNLPCHCCADTGSACGIVAMDLSPDSSLLAVAQLRAVLKEAADDAPPRRAHSAQTQAGFNGGSVSESRFGEGPGRFSPELDGAADGKTARSRSVKEWKGDTTTVLSGVHTLKDGMDVEEEDRALSGICGFPRRATSKGDEPAAASAMAGTQTRKRLSVPRRDARLLASDFGPRGVSARDSVARAPVKRDVWRVEGETTILSVAEGLKVVKTLAVADASFFTSVEFSRNGKHLLMGGGTSDSSFCVDCRACSCCCLCFVSRRNREESQRWKDDQERRRRATLSPRGEEEATEDGEAAGCCSRDHSSRCMPQEDEDGQAGKGERFRQRPSESGREPQAEEAGPAHRAQLVNLLQSNRLAVLKSPADGALAFADASLLQLALSSENATDQSVASSAAFHSPLAWPPGDLTRVQISQVPPPPFLSSSLQSTSLRLRLFSPDSAVLDCRRRAFWKGPAAAFPLLSGEEDENLENVVSASSRPAASRAASPKEAKSGNASAASPPVSAAAGPSSLRAPQEVRDRFKDSREATTDPSGRLTSTPFPQCHPQISQFLSACGPLHPHWGRPSCMHDRFVVALWGGLVAGVGGSPHYPGLKLWQATTGVVLSWTEGILATPEAVRCVRGHADLSTGLLVTAGALPARLSREDSRFPSACRLATGKRRREQDFLSESTGGRHARRPGVTLWSLIHRDVLLETALRKEIEGESAFLLVDPDDEDAS